MLQQKRQKWNETSPNSQVGDVVVIRDETSHVETELCLQLSLELVRVVSLRTKKNFHKNAEGT